MSGFSPDELPPLDGYDFVEAKPDAQVILTSDRGDPVLAKWQFGLGRVVAWTADNGVDLAADWETWDRADEFWAALVRWTLPDPDQRPLQVTVSTAGPDAVITAETPAQSVQATGLATLTATLTSPTGEVLSGQPMTQSGPGQYQLHVPAPDPGAYQIELRQERAGETVTEQASFAVPPSPELQPAPGARELLESLARRTGGRLLSLDDPSQAFTRGGHERHRPPNLPAALVRAGNGRRSSSSSSRLRAGWGSPGPPWPRCSPGALAPAESSRLAIAAQIAT